MNLVESIQDKKRQGLVPILAEVKRLIPKLAEKGVARDGRDASIVARAYEAGGAAGISLVSERRYFGGQPEVDLPAILRAVALPLLVKDFILSPESVDLYAALVDGVGEGQRGRICLLLTAHLVGPRLPAMLHYVHQQGMLALVETRQVEDLRYLEGASPKVVGINNKNIDELEKGEDLIRIDAAMVRRYREFVGDAILLSQSAHHSPKDVRQSIEAGADAVLVGTAFMTSPHPTQTVASFANAFREGT